MISAAFPGLSVTFGEDRPQSYPADDHVLRLRYGWSPRYSLKQDLPLVLQRWKEARAQEQSGKHPIWDFLRNHSKPWIAFEICVTFILEELLRTAVQGDSQLGTVDLRLFFPCRAVIFGPTPLTGRDIDVPDLRGGFSHLIAALAASGPSDVHGISLIDRGYADFRGKLEALGADFD